MNDFSVTAATIIANIIGGLIFFWVDRLIFTSTYLSPQGEIRDEAPSSGNTKGLRLTRTRNYDRSKDNNPELRHKNFSQRVLRKLKERGIRLK